MGGWTIRHFLKLCTSVDKVIKCYHSKNQVNRSIRSRDMTSQSLDKKCHDDFRHSKKFVLRRFELSRAISIKIKTDDLHRCIAYGALALLIAR